MTLLRAMIQAALPLLLLGGPTLAAEPTRPNVLLILADDLGWRDVGYHQSEIRTPNIDRIAREGIELDRFYVQPICTPTRAALMTGKSPMRLGVNRPIAKIDEAGLPLEEKILPQFLGDLGYQTLMVGKWHLGHFTPDLFPHARGFEHFYGHVTGGIGYWDHNHGGGHDWQRNGETLREEGYSTELIADEAIRLIDNRDTSRPTFLYVAFNAPHTPNEAPADTVHLYNDIPGENRRLHAAMVDELDQAIGRILQTYERLGILDDTIVFFASDNGGLSPNATPAGLQRVMRLFSTYLGRPVPVPALEFLASNSLDGASDNSPLRGGKGNVTEGAVRVPAAVWWPGHLEGQRFEGFMSISDVLPTLLDAIGAPTAIPPDLDGASQWPALTNDKNTTRPPDFIISGLPTGLAIYRPPWKLVDPDEPKLYDIYADPLEENDVAAQHPKIVASLVARARSWPRGPETGRSLFSIVLDPDLFGGPEDRPPWADVARDRRK